MLEFYLLDCLSRWLFFTPNMRQGRRKGETRDTYAWMMLLSGVMKVGLDNIPPVTLLLGIGQLAVFFLDDYTRTHSICVLPAAVWYGLEFYRLLTGVVYHLSDNHIAFNMASLLYKGIVLENALGSPRFLCLTLLLTVLSSTLFVLLAVVLSEVDLYPGAMSVCAAGFSGVLFAYTVVINHDHRVQGHTQPRLLGMQLPVLLPTKHLAWFELFMIYYLVPGSSFLGHLAGILAGLLYLTGIFHPLLSFCDGVTAASLFGGQPHINRPEPVAAPGRRAGGGNRVIRDGVIYYQ
eukprot:gb/GEZN01009505.1/.p1 GENE.gb/GEZN01009505.1/~~gb/GEZN01009505.1/.p1  ORF type:complete len:292 (-),score=21.39 gb/GEZN01009505.1/:397-1272(-)